MATFHVYVEGPTDRSGDGVQRLSAAISRAYGLPAAELATRLSAGRFRVKANVDRATADTYLRSLEELGARVTIEEAHPTQPVPVTPAAPPPRSGPTLPPSVLPPPPRSKSTSHGAYSVASPTSARTSLPRSSASVPPANAARPSTSSLPPATGAARPSTSSLPPATGAARPSTSSLPSATGAPANAARTSSPSLSPPAVARTATPQPFISGLSAAFTDESPASDLGALGDGSLALSSLDGDEDNRPQGGAFDLPSGGLPASIGPATVPAVPAAPAARAPTTDAPLDLFAPPDAAEAEVEMALAPEELEHRARKLNTPPAGVPVASPDAASGPTSPPPTPAMRRSAPIPVQGGFSAPGARETPRVRFAAGVLLSILLGFVPAHVIASMREDSAFATIDAQVHATQLQAETPEMYRQLDAFRAAQMSRKESEQRSIAMTSMLIWGIVAAGLAYVWFRRIPWDRLGNDQLA